MNFNDSWAFRRMTLTERFWARVSPEPNSGCWLWTGLFMSPRKNYLQYGIFMLPKHKKVSAHRFSWKIHNGEIPDSKFVCHKCDNPACVNPDHLFLGTHQDNMDDMAKKNRRRPVRGSASHLAKLTDSLVVSLFVSKESVRFLTEKHGVPKVTIYKIKQRKAWAHLTGEMDRG